ncbi:MAG: DoxX family protein [Solirubrobacteraceae bacterium]
MATAVVIGLTVALFAFSSAIKIAGLRRSLQVRDHIGIAPDAWRTIGMLELAGAAGILLGLAVWLPIGCAAAFGLLLVGIGAAMAHRRVGDGVGPIATALAAAALALLSLVLLAAS